MIELHPLTIKERAVRVLEVNSIGSRLMLFDQEGKILSEAFDMEMPFDAIRIAYDYGIQGTLSCKKFYRRDGSPSQYIHYQYENGRMIERESVLMERPQIIYFDYTKDGQKFRYVVDENGNRRRALDPKSILKRMKSKQSIGNGYAPYNGESGLVEVDRELYRDHVVVDNKREWKKIVRWREDQLSLEEFRFRLSNESFLKTIYFFDFAQRHIRTSIQNQTELLYLRHRARYVDNEVIVEEIQSDGRRSRLSRCQLNVLGQVLICDEVFFMVVNGGFEQEIHSIWEVDYDEQGNVIKEYLNSELYRTYEYQYDTYGNWVSRNEWLGVSGRIGGPYSSITRQIFYSDES